MFNPISIHAPAEGATQTTSTCVTSSGFQSTLPRRERPQTMHRYLLLPPISIHAPAEGATRQAMMSITGDKFQSTLPRRERLRKFCICKSFNFNFNPRSRGGSDFPGIRNISTWKYFNPRSRGGSDAYYRTLAAEDFLFQSTLPRRERQVSKTAAQIKYHDFNPRSRGGSDKQVRGAYPQNTIISIHAPAEGATEIAQFQSEKPFISIHAPAEGATFSYTPRLATNCNFNPRSRGGSDQAAMYLDRLVLTFQSTLPRRERLMGSDISEKQIKISIHAPAEGATVTCFPRRFTIGISIHAPAEGATYIIVHHKEEMMISIHAPADGATRKRPSVCLFQTFQSTLPRRERLLQPDTSTVHLHFNPRSRGGSDCLRMTSQNRRKNFNPRSRGGSDTTPGRRTAGYY